jgi:CDP-diglyceride synthetase
VTAPAAKPSSDLAIRTAVGAGLIAAAAAALALGGLMFWLLCVVAALFMMAEWSDLHAASPREKRIGQFALSVPLAVMAPPSLILENRDFFAAGLLAGAAIFAAIVTRRRSLGWGVLYCGLPVLALTVVRRQHEGVGWTLWALALVWACDIGAYSAGRTIGGPKLAPRISPNKTWAGLIGGVAAASAFGAAMHVWAGLPLRMTLATPLLAVVSQGGDLYESWMKRRAGVKDSGNLLPGHGGVMDRLDGLVPVAPLAALLVVLPKFYP